MLIRQPIPQTLVLTPKIYAPTGPIFSLPVEPPVSDYVEPVGPPELALPAIFTDFGSPPQPPVGSTMPPEFDPATISDQSFTAPRDPRLNIQPPVGSMEPPPGDYYSIPGCELSNTCGQPSNGSDDLPAEPAIPPPQPAPQPPQLLVTYDGNTVTNEIPQVTADLPVVAVDYPVEPDPEQDFAEPDFYTEENLGIPGLNSDAGSIIYTGSEAEHSDAHPGIVAPDCADGQSPTWDGAAWSCPAPVSVTIDPNTGLVISANSHTMYWVIMAAIVATLIWKR